MVKKLKKSKQELLAAQLRFKIRFLIKNESEA